MSRDRRRHRVETALHLLAEGRAEWLLVSGIGPGPDLATLAKRSLADAATLAARIELGRQATSTRGNAAETADWVRTQDIHSLIVVTAWYHMPWAMTEIARAVPGVVLYPAPVDPGAHIQPGGRRGGAMARLLAEEYLEAPGLAAGPDGAAAGAAAERRKRNAHPG